MYRAMIQYVDKGKKTATLNTSVQRFEKYIRKVHKKKKVKLLIEAFFPDTKVYTCIFEFKKAKLKSNQERVGKE